MSTLRTVTLEAVEPDTVAACQPVPLPPTASSAQGSSATPSAAAYPVVDGVHVSQVVLLSLDRGGLSSSPCCPALSKWIVTWPLPIVAELTVGPCQ
eukprot:COSAG01_NODE_3301_length_6295_cov_20.275823_6_plen_96_part_00